MTALTALAAPATDQALLADANTGFAFDLMKQIVGEQPNVNVFISPYSVSSTLQLLANGAAGDTRTEMLRALKTGDLPLEALDAACGDLNQSLKAQHDVVLTLANALWFQEGIRLKPGFVVTNGHFFKAELAPVDFKKPESARTINDWADNQTHGKVKDVVSWPFDPLTRVILANAIYFKGKWDRPFDRSATKSRAFHLASGETRKVPMMSQRGNFSYQTGDGYQAVRLPYAGDRLQMDLFLPDTNSSPVTLLAGLVTDTWRNRVRSGFRDQEGSLVFPRFKMSFEVTLNDPLQALGIRHAFDDADFSALAGEPLFVSKMKQKSYVEVNEQGTEAAAVTTTVMAARAVMEPEKPFEMIVDRPFFFVIEDSETQTILFMGVVYDPAGQGS